MLAPLTAAEEDLLCGRAAEVEAVVENCEAGRLTMLKSPAGFGATSLLQAGVEPALRRAGYITVIHSDWQDRSLSARLREAIIAAVRAQAERNYDPPQETLAALLKDAELTTKRTLAVLLDQFEDYLLCHSGTDASDTFDAELANAISSRTARFVIAIHPAAIPELERLSPFIRNLLGHTVTLPPLDMESARELVRRISRLGDKAIEEIVTMPVAAVDEGVNPSFITLAAREHSAGERPARTVFTALDSTIEQLRSGHRDLLFRWVPALVSANRHRLTVSLKTLTEYSGGNADSAAELVPILIKAGLLRSLTTSRGDRYQLPHEVMAPILQDWHRRTTARRAERRQTMFRAVSVLVGMIALIAAFLIYSAER